MVSILFIFILFLGCIPILGVALLSDFLQFVEHKNVELGCIGVYGIILSYFHILFYLHYFNAILFLVYRKSCRDSISCNLLQFVEHKNGSFKFDIYFIIICTFTLCIRFIWHSHKSLQMGK
jgi:hypothetical protein